MQYLRSVLKYIITFILTLAILTLFLTATALIPNDTIKDNMQESVKYYCDHLHGNVLITGVSSSGRHLYADEITLSIAWNFDNDKPLQSVMESNYYVSIGDESLLPLKMIEVPENSTRQYLRYWHGSAAVVRFEHVFMNIQQIYVFHVILMAGLLLWLLGILLKNRLKVEALCLSISMILVSAWFVPICLEYTWTFLVMLVASIVGVKLALKEKFELLGLFFFITGIVTVFFDFLTTETLTLVIPLLLMIRILNRPESATKNVSEYWSLTIKGCSLWLIGFAGMWISKWIVASGVLGYNVMPMVTGHIGERIDGGNESIGLLQYAFGAVGRNIKCLFPLEYGIIGAMLICVVIVFFILIPVIQGRIRLRMTINKRLLALYLTLSCIPVVRFMVLHNHSWYHQYFTYRALAGTVLALLFAVTEMIERDQKDD